MTEFEHWASACADKSIPITEITRGAAYPRTGIYMTRDGDTPWYHVFVSGRWRYSAPDLKAANAEYQRILQEGASA